MRVPYDEVDFVYITNHWDIHLDGLCKYNGKLCHFETDQSCFDYDDIDDWNPMVEITQLTRFQTLSALFSKKMFEFFVGRHYSYKNGETGPDFTMKKFGSRVIGTAMFHAYYKAHKIAKAVCGVIKWNGARKTS